MKELIKEFCQDKDISTKSNKWMCEPFIQDSYVYATEAHILIKCKNNFDNDYTNLETPNMNDFYKEEVGGIKKIKNNIKLNIIDLENQLNNLEKEDEIKYIKASNKCEECNGECEVEYEYFDSKCITHYKYFDCPLCDGEGYLNPSKSVKTDNQVYTIDSLINIKNTSFKPIFIEKILKVMEHYNINEINVYINPNKCKPSLFIINDDIEIILMPYVN